MMQRNNVAIGDERYERKEFQEQVKKVYEQHFIGQNNW